DPARRAGTKAELAQGQVADVLWVEAVDILARIDPVDQRTGVAPVRQRQLDQDAVNLRIGVEAVDQLQQLGIGGRGRQVVVQRSYPDFLGCPTLVADVYRRGRIVAHQHDCQAGRRQPACQALVDPRLQLLQQLLGNLLAIEDAGL